MAVRIEEKLARKTLKKLHDGPVPIVAQSKIAEVAGLVTALNQQIHDRAYIPSNGHGFLSLEKNMGVSRFVPIISAEDMVVYYQVCGDIGEKVLVSRKGIYGGWNSVPTSQQVPVIAAAAKDDTEAKLQVGPYFSDSFSNSLWLNEFKSFTELIRGLTERTDIGNYVITSDISNFYDSIEVPRLIERLRKDASDLNDQVGILEIFLGLWNRRTSGYRFSTKGIPQEIISDASRILSHYYLQLFDEKFSAYCESFGLTYVRWADDLIIFGNAKSKLENALHRASRLLLAEGLHLNAGKTKIYSRKDYAAFRAVDVLKAIDSNKVDMFRKKLRTAVKNIDQKPFRVDTVFRAAISFIHRHKPAAKVYERNFLEEFSISHPSLLGTLNEIQLLRLIEISDDPSAMFARIRKYAVDKPYTGPRSNLLQLLRRKPRELKIAGISAVVMQHTLKEIEKVSGDSEIITQFCLPAALEKVDTLR